MSCLLVPVLVLIPDMPLLLCCLTISTIDMKTIKLRKQVGIASTKGIQKRRVSTNECMRWSAAITSYDTNLKVELFLLFFYVPNF